MKTWQKGKGRGAGEWDSKEEGESLGVRRGLGRGMLWHGNPSLLVMLACIGVWAAGRPQSPAWLPPTWRWLEPGYKEWTCHWLLLVNKPNTVGKMRCEAEDAAVSMPCLCLPLALAHQPPTFSSCVSEKSNTTPFLHWCPELLNFLKTMCRFICLPRELLRWAKSWSSALHAWLKTTLQFKSSLPAQKDPIPACHS